MSADPIPETPVSSPVGPVTEEDVERLRVRVKSNRTHAELRTWDAGEARYNDDDAGVIRCELAAKMAWANADAWSRLLAAVERDRAARATAPALSEEDMAAICDGRDALRAMADDETAKPRHQAADATAADRLDALLDRLSRASEPASCCGNGNNSTDPVGDGEGSRTMTAPLWRRISPVVEVLLDANGKIVGEVSRSWDRTYATGPSGHIGVYLAEGDAKAAVLRAVQMDPSSQLSTLTPVEGDDQ